VVPDTIGLVKVDLIGCLPDKRVMGHLGVVLPDVEIDQLLEQREAFERMQVKPLVTQRTPECRDHGVAEADLHLGKLTGYTLQASSLEAPSEYLGARATRLVGECFESGEIVFIDAKRNHSGFLFCVGARFESGTVRGVTMDGQRRARLVDLRLTWRCEIK
jgi:hypothetical protein